VSDSADLSARITEVVPGSSAANADVRVGDVVVMVNDRPIRDIIEWHHQVDEAFVTLRVDRGGMQVDIEVEKAAGEPLGVSIASAVFDRVQTCDNHCSFCFIYQLPKGLRRSLYLKDDDYRLSFLFGNFTTLTRFTEMDLERVVDQALSPLHVSIHDTDPWGRAEMLRNERGAMSLRWLRALLDNGTRVRGQVVLCPRLNDGEVLERTMAGVLDEFPEIDAVAIVPLGLSRFNPEAQLRIHTVDEARATVDLIDTWRNIAQSVVGHPMFWASDELYLLAGRDMPPVKEYGDFPMYEDGVGIVASFVEEFEGRRRVVADVTSGFFASVDGATPGGYRGERAPINPAGDTGLRPARVQLSDRRMPRGEGKIGVLTGEYAAPVLSKLVTGLNVSVIPVHNEFFGGNTAVAGLMVGVDIAREISNHPEIDQFLLPDVCLSENRFLDGTTLADLPSNVTVVPTDGASLRRILDRSL
jgi:putative radical SAM enzyme (TIGR03279 family)